jgi:hypothetical protein
MKFRNLSFRSKLIRMGKFAAINFVRLIEIGALFDYKYFFELTIFLVQKKKKLFTQSPRRENTQSLQRKAAKIISPICY